MNITFQRENMSMDLIKEAMPLTRQHTQETDPFPTLKPGIDWEAYMESDKAGILRAYTARNGSLLGYALFGIYVHPHYTDSLQASQDAVFIKPDSRNGLLGLKFMRWCDEQLKNDGVSVIYQYSSNRRNIGPILKRLGYEHIQDLYARRLS